MPPVITLVGANPQTVTVGDAYVELGATASDNYDGDITGSIVIDSTEALVESKLNGAWQMGRRDRLTFFGNYNDGESGQTQIE